MPRTRGLTQTASTLIAIAAATGIAIAAIAPEPSPDPRSSRLSHAAAPLRIIGRVRARTLFCQRIYAEAAPATSAALLGDAAINDDENYLSTVDLDTTVLAQQHGIQEIGLRYTTLWRRSRAAIEETKALRKIAAEAHDPEQRDALVAYAEALGGALHRQVMMAQDLSRFMTYLQNHQPISQEQRDEDLLAASSAPIGLFERNHSEDPRDRVPPTLSEIAQGGSTQLRQRHQVEIEDETRAAETADMAFGPCMPEASPSTTQPPR